MATCKKCQAEIKWITTIAGKYIPVDPAEVAGIDLEHIDTLITHDGQILKGKNAAIAVGFIPHWATCPFADDFRKTKVPDRAGAK